MQKRSLNNQPFLKPTVSVIIPVLNASETIRELLDILHQQTYDADKTEIFIVDNGSDDYTITKARQYPVTVLQELSVKSPYAARNFGLKQAKGEIIAMTDANKIPEKTWIEEGVKALNSEKADLAGGDIQFRLSDHPTAAEVYDAITFNDNRRFVAEENGAATGNLFFRKEVLREMGFFPEKARSGMDIWWTQNAVRNGHKLVYAEKAVVWCKPRNLKQVLKKSYRVGISHPFNQKQAGKSTIYILMMILRTFMPPKVRPLKEKMNQIKPAVPVSSVWRVVWLSKIYMGFGRISGLFRMNSESSIREKNHQP